MVSFCACLSRAQNPVQWSGSVSQSVDRAAEQSLPLLFWVTGGRGADDDLSDAQSECFRDPVVVGIVQKHFVPVRVSRSSNVIEQAEKLGLPTSHGLYCAVVTFDGKLMGQMGPDVVADPVAFAAQLNQAYAHFCQDLYERDLRPLLEDPAAPKEKVRLAVQTVWRLGIHQADGAVIAVLNRKDLQPSERSRLYELLASLGTQSCIAALLDRADDKAAAAALLKAEPGALDFLIPALPTEDGPVTARQMAAYQSVARICRMPSTISSAWWEKAKPDDRRKELEQLKARAQTVADYWHESQGLSR
jgi:hypothetical protein